MSDASPQLVRSATSDTNNDAFNFLSKGAGVIVFELILKVREIAFSEATLADLSSSSTSV